MSSNKLIDSLIKRCKKKPLNIGLPESDDPRTFKAAEICLKNQSVKSAQFFTSKVYGMKICRLNGIDLELFKKNIEWVCPETTQIISKTEEHLAKVFAAKKKEISQKKLREMAENTLNQAAYYLSSNQSDITISGATNTTGNVIRAGLCGVGLANGIKTVSGSFLLNRELPTENRTYIYGDCGVVIDPSSQQLVDIASSCVHTWRTVVGVDIEPVVAFLSFSTKGSAKHDMANKVIEATKLFQEKYPEVCCDGEFQFDAAFDESIGNKKAPNSKVPGKANIFIFPNLDSGNIAYKITQRLAGFDAYGPILQGLQKPFSDLSRGATAEDIAASIYINSLRASS